MIEFLDVVKSYSVGNKALDGVSMTIEDGEFAFLVGPSGSGKSTIIKLITGELKPTSGTVHVNGYSLERIRKREIPYLRRTVGVVFQDFRLIETKTVYENVAFAMEVLGEPRSAIKHKVPIALEIVGLSGKENVMPLKLSGGEKQRLSIARAVLKNPGVLIFDEATSAVDSETEKLIQDAINRLIRGRTTLMIAHRLSTVIAADKIMVIEKGIITAEGSHQELIAKSEKYKELYETQFRRVLDMESENE